MSTGTIFENNEIQVVGLPLEARFDEGVKKVLVRKHGKERILAPLNHGWDSFFHSKESVSDDFLSERPSQEQSGREEF